MLNKLASKQHQIYICLIKVNKENYDHKCYLCPVFKTHILSAPRIHQRLKSITQVQAENHDNQSKVYNGACTLCTHNRINNKQIFLIWSTYTEHQTTPS